MLYTGTAPTSTTAPPVELSHRATVPVHQQHPSASAALTITQITTLEFASCDLTSRDGVEKELTGTGLSTIPVFL